MDIKMVPVNGKPELLVTRTPSPATPIPSPEPSTTQTEPGASAGGSGRNERNPAPPGPSPATPFPTRTESRPSATGPELQATSGREAARKSRAEAARENGRKSRGPKTREGKARSSLNALKHGLTARRVTINSEEDADWEEFLAACRAELQPVGVIELSYADEFAASRWRLQRCLGIETVIFDDEFAHQEKDIKKYSILDDVARTGLAFKKIKEDLNALGRYETRIRRAGERALANLLKLQSRRQNESTASTPEPVAAEACSATPPPNLEQKESNAPSESDGITTGHAPQGTCPAQPQTQGGEDAAVLASRLLPSSTSAPSPAKRRNEPNVSSDAAVLLAPTPGLLPSTAPCAPNE